MKVIVEGKIPEEARVKILAQWIMKQVKEDKHER